jgi:hypothetical protein
MSARSLGQQDSSGAEALEELPKEPFLLPVRRKIGASPAGPAAKKRRSLFSPAALAAMERMVDDVWRELTREGALVPGSGRTEAQTRDLLLRAFRNEASAKRNRRYSLGLREIRETSPERKVRGERHAGEPAPLDWSRSPVWKAIRRRRLAQEPKCRICAADGKSIAASHVDHVVPHEGNKSLFFSYANTQSLCPRHHRLHQQQMKRRDRNGESCRRKARQERSTALPRAR